jgi:hypothetical protein
MLQPHPTPAILGKTKSILSYYKHKQKRRIPGNNHLDIKYMPAVLESKTNISNALLPDSA